MPKIIKIGSLLLLLEQFEVATTTASHFEKSAKFPLYSP